jgi:catechol 2,3-dioxygenase
MFPYHQLTLPVPTQIHLNVKNLMVMKQFYQTSLGLKLYEEVQDNVILGTLNQPLLVLHHTPAFTSASSTESHLYHFAILVNKPVQLAHILQKLVSQGTRLDGASDHQISHAVYLSDPEGNGIELAYDKDASFWPMRKDGLLDGQAMIKPFDADYYLNLEVPKDHVWHEEAILGHVHFYAYDLEATHSFMVESLGYHLTMNLNEQARFYSVHGYHHHIGFNRWGNFKTPLSENKLGLRKLVFDSTSIDESKTLVDPNGFVFEINKK